MTETDPTINGILCNAIREAVFEHYMETAGHASVRDIAKRLGWSEYKVRNVLKKNYGAVRGTTAERVSVEKYSKDYPDMVCGYAQAWAYVPQMSYLRDRLLAAMGRPDPLDKTVNPERDDPDFKPVCSHCGKDPT